MIHVKERLSVEPELFLSYLPEQALLFDIETTGLSAANSFVYMLGLVWYEGGSLYLSQYLAEAQEDEGTLIRLFADRITPETILVSYNGEAFDLPFLLRRAKLPGIPFPDPESLYSLDIYRRLQPFKTLLGLPDLKQKSLEKFLSLPGRRYPDGRKCISIYKAFLKEPADTKEQADRRKDSQGQEMLRQEPHLQEAERINRAPSGCVKIRDVHAEVLSGHNREDLKGLLLLLPMLSYQGVFEEAHYILSTGCENDSLHLTALLEQPVPVPFFLREADYVLHCEKNILKLTAAGKEGRFRLYHSNFRDYVYLPVEDTCVPRALSGALGKEYKLRAVRETCYTWWHFDDSMAAHPERLGVFLKNTLDFLYRGIARTR